MKHQKGENHAMRELMRENHATVSGGAVAEGQAVHAQGKPSQGLSNGSC